MAGVDLPQQLLLIGKTSKMRKFHILALCLMAAFFLTNCGGGEAEAGGESSSSVLNLEKGKEAKDGDYTFKLLKVADSQVMTPEGKIEEGMAAEIQIDGPEGGWITMILKGKEEYVYSGDRVGDRPISYVLNDLSEEKQTASLSRKVGEPLE